MTEAFPPGHVFHRRYEVVRCLNAGGMGAVYEVIHKETRRRRALKVMLPSVVENRDMHARFQLEARIAADIESEHIVETFDAGVDEDTGAPFLVMELLRGEDLGSLLARCGPLPPDAVVGILSQVASALTRTHAASVIHRDLKPENLFVARRDDGTPKIKILDFGIAKVVAESGQAAARTKVMGTPLYMSPEQIRGDGAVSTRADLYALGHIAFTLLVGRGYWSEQAKQDDVYALMLKIAGGGGPAATAMASSLGGGLPAGFDPWFARATAQDPPARFAAAPELVEALAAVLGVPPATTSATFTLPTEPSVTSPPPAAGPPKTTNLITDSIPIAAPSMTTLGANMVTEPAPSQSAPDTIPMSSPPGSIMKPTPASLRKLQRAAVLSGVVGAAIAAVIATRLAFRPIHASVVSQASAAVTSSSSADARPGPLGGHPAEQPGVTPIEDAGSPRADAEASLPLVRKPRPVHPISLGSAAVPTASTPVPSATAITTASDESRLFLPRH